MGTWFNKLYAIMDKGPIRALSLILAITLVVCIFTGSDRFAAQTSPLEVWHFFVIIWAVCTAMVHGVGFRPQRLRWRILFTPLPAILILIACLYYYFA